MPRPRCERCALPLPPKAGPLCGECLACAAHDGLDACEAAVDYAYPWDGLVARFKFRGEPAWAGTFARLLRRSTRLNTWLQEDDLLVPVPADPQRLATRGYNPAWNLAKALRRGSPSPAIDTLPMGLVRLGTPRAQHDLPRAERLRNARGTLAAHPEHAARLHGRRVLLVDDVCTTGATLEAAAQALRAAGARSVRACVFARTPDDRGLRAEAHETRDTL